MGNDNFKPDLGLALSERYSQEITHHFYSIPLIEILHVGNNLFSTMVGYTVEEVDFAVSFDFDNKLLIELLLQIQNKGLKEYLENVLLKEFTGPEKAVFYETPIHVDIEARLGNLVKSKYETFVPLIVEKFENVIEKQIIRIT
ncbi:MAG: hypothetical protein IPH62_15400 [Ignavibacteriae bacterium]|nr:hypothetical protein [Ignavibacteriota bacterium]